MKVELTSVWSPERFAPYGTAVTAAMGEDEQSLLAAMMVAMPVSVGIAWLILRSVFRNETPAKLVSASALVILYPYAALLFCAVVYAVSPVDNFDRWYMRNYSLGILSIASAVLLVALWFTLFIRPLGKWSYGAIAGTVLAVGICLVAWEHEQVTVGRFDDGYFWALPLVMLMSSLVGSLILRSLFPGERRAKVMFAASLLGPLACTMPSYIASLFALGADGGLVGIIFATVGAIIFVFLPAMLLLLLWLVASARHSLRREASYTWEASAALLLSACTIWWAANTTWWTTFDKL